MFRRGLALCVVLGFASVANAGAVLELTMSDMGGLDTADPPNVCCWTDLPGPVQIMQGDSFMVHAFMTTDTTLTSGARLIQLDAEGPLTTVPMSWMGVDADTVNQEPDDIGNFWFDYTEVSAVGRFPAQGEIEILPGVFVSTTAGHTDFSNVGDGPVSTVWASTSAGSAMFFFNADVPVHVGAMVINVPEDAALGMYTLDLLNSTAQDINSGAAIQFDFDNPTDWGVFNGMVDYGPGAGVSGPATFEVIPEPMTLVLLGLGGVAALRRRR
jgi:hypothetical protein